MDHRVSFPRMSYVCFFTFPARSELQPLSRSPCFQARSSAACSPNKMVLLQQRLDQVTISLKSLQWLHISPEEDFSLKLIKLQHQGPSLAQAPYKPLEGAGNTFTQSFFFFFNLQMRDILTTTVYFEFPLSQFSLGQTVLEQTQTLWDLVKKLSSSGP